MSNASARARNYRKRVKVLAHLGGVCKSCGFTDPRALQIDHVAGGGVRELRSMSHHNYLKKVMSDTSGTYQLLCANCNWIKRTIRNENPRPSYNCTHGRYSDCPIEYNIA